MACNIFSLYTHFIINNLSTRKLQLIIITSCDQNNNDDDIELSLFTKIINEVKKSDSSKVILNTRQGFFAYDSLNIDTGLLIYNGFIIGKDPGYYSSSHLLMNYYLEDTFYFVDFQPKLKYEQIEDIPIIDPNQIKDYIMPDIDSSSDGYSINWLNLNENGFNRIYTFSESYYDTIKRFGFVGLNIYSKGEFEEKVYFYVNSSDFGIFEFWHKKFKIVNYQCQFRNDSLIELDPNLMIIK